MKILLLNGSPHKNGTTNEALKLLAKLFVSKNISCEVFHIGSRVESCRGCFKCADTRTCVVNDSVNKLLDTIENYDSIIIGTPVYFASPAGGIISFLDRLFESGYEKIMYKPASAFSVARRAGTAACNDVINKYFLFNNMPIIPTSYLNSIIARVPEEIYNDQEGIQLLNELANNMEWMMKSLQESEKNNIKHPEIKKKYYLTKLDHS